MVAPEAARQTASRFMVRATTDDHDEVAAVMQRLYGARVRRAATPPSEPAEFSYSLDGTPSVSLARLSIGGEYAATSDPTSFFAVARVIRGHLTVRTATREIRRSDETPFLFPIDEVQHHEWHDVALSTLHLDARIVRDVAIERGHVGLHLSPGAEPRNPQVAERWLRAERHFARQLHRVEPVLSPIATAELARSLAALLLEVFPAGGPLPGGRGGRVGSSALARAVHYIDEHAREAIGLHEIAEAARLSPRGLQHAFHRAFDMSPLQYLRRVRLDAVRTELVTADPTSGRTVGEIAQAWGFAHLGRFAALYRETYGEAPSSTLRR